MNHSKTKEIYILMKKSITDGIFKPGMQLKEDYFSTLYDVSRTTVRKALKLLEADGFVESIYNKGSYVTKSSIKDIYSAYRLRVQLEEILSPEIIDNATSEVIETLENCIALEKEFFKTKDILGYIENNKKFHIEIARLSNNKYLVEAIEQILKTIDIHLLFYDNYHHIGLQDFHSKREHEEIVKYLKEKKFSQLKRTMIQHTKDACKKLEIQKNKTS